MRQYSGTGVVFQSTHPSGVRPDTVTRHQNSSDFNPRTPVGCDACRCAAAWSSAYFNPRTPVGCDCHCDLGEVAAFHISIHAPQWGATRPGDLRRPRHGHFNPRTPVGCDSESRKSMMTVTVFQSTHPSGVRRAIICDGFHVGNISIHAPQWGATPCPSLCPSTAVYFNPRTPVGCDYQTAAGRFA